MLGGAKRRGEDRRRHPLEGMMVQLVADKNGMRTTVFSDSEGPL
jgi:hypothetical protein